METTTFGQGASFGDAPFWLCNKKCLDHTIIFYHGVNTFFLRIDETNTVMTV